MRDEHLAARSTHRLSFCTARQDRRRPNKPRLKNIFSVDATDVRFSQGSARRLSYAHSVLVLSGVAPRIRKMPSAERTVRLRFCPNSNDLLYPKEDRERKKLVYICRNCDYAIDSDGSCVYRHHISHSALETTTIIADVTSDPTLPLSRGVRCIRCENREAVFFSVTTSEGMSLFFQCTTCAHRWKDTGDAADE